LPGGPARLDDPEKGMGAGSVTVGQLLEEGRQSLLVEWNDASPRDGRGSSAARTEDSRALLEALEAGIAANGDAAKFEAPAWSALRDVLADVSSSDAAQGRSAGQTSGFILALKRPIFLALQQRLGSDAAALMSSILWVSQLVDAMAQFTAAAYQTSREEMIQRQQRELLELSTPVVKLWEGVLAVPMIGTLDSGRSQLVMEALLQRIVETGSELAIIDITGVPTVDTLVAQHLIKTVAAIRLMGADCIISGIRPQIAQTIVHLGIDLQGVTTKASLADALATALKRSGYVVTRAKP
jgi:rsbT co-antagonist protein RsbR